MKIFNVRIGHDCAGNFRGVGALILLHLHQAPASPLAQEGTTAQAGLQGREATPPTSSKSQKLLRKNKLSWIKIVKPWRIWGLVYDYAIKDGEVGPRLHGWIWCWSFPNYLYLQKLPWQANNFRWMSRSRWELEVPINYPKYVSRDEVTVEVKLNGINLILPLTTVPWVSMIIM